MMYSEHFHSKKVQKLSAFFQMYPTLDECMTELEFLMDEWVNVWMSDWLMSEWMKEWTQKGNCIAKSLA